MIRIGTTATLAAEEQETCRSVSEQIQKNKRDTNTPNAKRSGESDLTIQIEGLGAEIAFCKLFGLTPDLSIHNKSAARGEDTGDALLLEGLRVDVKVTKYRNGRLLLCPWKVNSAVDLYALMTVTENPSVYTFKGFMHKTDLIQEHRLNKKTGNLNYTADQHELLELEYILDAIRAS